MKNNSLDGIETKVDENVEQSLKNQTYLEEMADAVKQVLLNGDSKIGYVDSCTNYFDAKGKRLNKPKRISKFMPRKLFDLGKMFGIGFPSDIIYYECCQGGPYEGTLFSTKFTPVHTTPYSEKIFIPIVFYEKSPEWQIEEVEKRQKKLKRFQEKVSKSTNGKYDKKGILSLPRYSTNTGYRYEYNEKPLPPEAWISEYIDIEITQRELAEAGILPDDFKWVEKAKISAKDIAEADKEQALTTTEVGGFKHILNKLKELFKGKDEK